MYLLGLRFAHTLYQGMVPTLELFLRLREILLGKHLKLTFRMKMMVMICVISFGHHNSMNNFLALFLKSRVCFT